jgi:hypothetical protein
VTGAAVGFSARSRIATAGATPAGTTVVSGGHAVRRGARLGTLSIVADRPLGSRRWSVTVLAQRIAMGATLRVFATCE